MEGREEKKMIIQSSTSLSLSLSETQLTNPVTAYDSDNFYTKLTDLLKPSGLNLIFNVRETLLDLHLLYFEVTKRGGYIQVTKERKWCEVASAMKLEVGNAKLLSVSDQLSSVYCYLLYRYEKLYFYRSPPKQATTSTTEGLTKRKRNSMASLSEDCSTKMTDGIEKEKPVLLQAPSNDKKKKKRRVGAPSGHTGYHIFLKQECARLKSCRLDLDGRRILRVAVDTWSNMSLVEKQPYVEESQKCKEKRKKAMMTNEKQQSMEDRKCEENRPSVCGESGGDYCVTSQPEVYESVVNKAAMDMALEITEKASKDPLFLADWDSFGSLDLPPGEYK